MKSPTNHIKLKRDALYLTLSVKEASIEDVLEAVEDALRGLGYAFDGSVDIVEDEGEGDTNA